MLFSKTCPSPLSPFAPLPLDPFAPIVVEMNQSKILIVDDEQDLRQLFARVLAKAGYDTKEARSGREALDSVRAFVPDLILLDLYLGDTTGLEVLPKVLKICPNALVVIMTGKGEVETAVRAMKLGAIDYMLKPFEPERLKSTVQTLLEHVAGRSESSLRKRIIGESPRMQEVWTMIGRYALPDVSILFLGESGTGKELFARAVHEQSKRRSNLYVALDCATLPETLVESEIFGHEKGAFTGAQDRKIGKFEYAHGGTLFLDEIGNLPLHFQAKLLRSVQERYIERLGGNKPIPIDVRIVSATNLDVEQAMRKGTFREDLFFRLAEVVIRLPALREREGDIELLANNFVNEFNRKFDRNVQGISDHAMSLLRDYRWPGNVRELENVIKSSLLAADDLIGPEQLPEYIRGSTASVTQTDESANDFSVRIRQQVSDGLEGGSMDLKTIIAGYTEEIEEEVIRELLRRRQFTQAELSSLLQVDPKTLRAKLQKFGLRTR